MRHKWGKRSWWQRLLSGLAGATQTCRRCGAKFRVVRPMKLLPGRRRPARSVVRWYRPPKSLTFWRVKLVPPCDG